MASLKERALHRIRLMRGLRQSFRSLFLGPNGQLNNDGQAVLQELRRFCYAKTRPTIKKDGKGATDVYETFVMIGRQEVYVSIIQMLNLNDSDIRVMEQQVLNRTEDEDA